MYGAFILRVRRSRGLSQEALARVVGISQPNLSAYERGRRTPTADTLNRIVVACGYELAATDGRHVIHCPLPKAGWWPDDDIPPAVPDDPAGTAAAVTAETPMEDRVRVIMAVLDLGEAIR